MTEQPYRIQLTLRVYAPDAEEAWSRFQTLARGCIAQDTPEKNVIVEEICQNCGKGKSE